MGLSGNSKGLTGRLAFAIAAAVIGSAFQHGYNTGVVNAPQTLIEEFINQTSYDRSGEFMSKSGIKMVWSLAVSIYCVGGMVGGLLTAFISNRFGRKGGLLLNNVLVFVGAGLSALSKLAGSYEMIIIGRFFIGINSGLNAGIVPMYLSEMSPAHLKGAIGSSYQLVITISILLATVFGLPQCLGTSNLWPFLFGLTIIPAIFQLCTLPLCPESPRFLLLNRGQDVRAQEALTWLRGTIEVQDEMEEMKNVAEIMKSESKVTLRELLLNSVLRMPLIISVVIMLAQQLSGINATIFFSTEIFRNAGLSLDVALYATLGMGAINVVMTLVSLVLVEKAGRKTLLLVGFIGVDVICVLLAVCLALKDQVSWISYLSIVLVNAFIIFFASGPGSIPWFLVSELFGQNARSMATSIAITVNWGANFVVGVAFLPLAEVMGPYVFLVFATLVTIFVIFIFFFVPETKNKSPEDVAALFRQKSYQ